MSPTTNPKQKRRALLPSIESQTIAYLEVARKRGRHQPQWLTWAGFRVYLRYQRTYSLGPERCEGEVLVIASVEVPERFRGRGWYWRYCQLCAALSQDGVILESVIDEELAEAIRRRPEFVEYQPGNFLLKKASPLDWPLSLI